jgi:hypothetical protein
MAEKDGKRSWVMINQAPVLTLWAALLRLGEAMALHIRLAFSQLQSDRGGRNPHRN